MNVKIRWYRSLAGKHEFYVDGGKQALDDLWTWCKQNITGNFTSTAPRVNSSPYGWWAYFIFDDSGDAQIFKLTWG